jgi:uncharacterized membrane protein
MRLRAGLIVLMAVAYPLLAHLGALLHSAVLACGAVLILLTVLFSAGLWHGRIVAWLGWIALCAATIGLSLHGHARLPQYAVPVLIDGFVASLFGYTLRRGREPLIAGIIRIVDGEAMLRDSVVRNYARRLTLLWTLLMSGLALTALILALLLQPDGLLALFAITVPLPVSAAQWSWFANVINYALVGAFFALEIFWRRVALPQAPRRSLREFGLRIATLWPQLLRGGGIDSIVQHHAD